MFLIHSSFVLGLFFFIYFTYPYLESRLPVPSELCMTTMLILKASTFNFILCKACCFVLHLGNKPEINLEEKLFIVNLSASIVSYGF